ncbi:PREDICTED: ubiquitin carboxyl-terminal hydrolase CYLD-like [Gavialis gangeticus]|uniref:ubiquitin carboxyl-terminal hydrolase CYLD-like n=1 Tax=Gavialis gangeticus TaxID=94835 RepID=UPI00092FC064|nr:PREDICTED: ubiquitin carboxyl-terminal hydrolase CYLD-like [Gavialis gangeticus]
MTTAIIPTSPPPAQGDGNFYFILTDEFPYGSKLFQAGHMCFVSERSYMHFISIESTPKSHLRVTMLQDNSTVTVSVGVLQPLKDQEPGFLLAVGNQSERLNCFLERQGLEAAMKAKLGQQVVVNLDLQQFPGIIRYIGKIDQSTWSPLSAIFFGVELQGDGESRGRVDGSFHGVRYFKCKQNCGIFLPFNKINFVPGPDSDRVKQESKPDATRVDPVKVGDAVGFYLDEILTKGLAVGVYKEGDRWFVRVCSEEEGTTDSFRDIPMDSVVKEGLLSPAFEPVGDPGFQKQLMRERSQNGNEWESGHPSLGVNSLVQLSLDKGNQVSGTIRWVGNLPRTTHKMAGVELDEDKGITDGEWQGVRYFQCPSKRGIFVKLQSCQPDMRFQCSSSTSLDSSSFNELDSPQVLDSCPPLRDHEAVRVLKGQMRGIQGHCNSCYMDVALFSLFSCTSVLDSMLFKPPPISDRNVQKILRDEIVTPLRRNGFVTAQSVMHLRQQLTEKGQCSSFTTSEKDPEEFLNLIMHHILGIEPLLRLQSRGRKEQDCYCYQIFMDKQEDLVVPNVQQLVERSFLSSELKLVEIPSCFIIQMPRFGKEYKMFSKIIPSLELDITDLLLDSPRECSMCGDVATQECSECFKDQTFAMTGLKQFCNSCCRQVHSHYQRKAHWPTKLHVPDEFPSTSQLGSQRVPREKMELFAVLCIETSHYVSFVKYGPEKENWMFFDSMADRHGDETGFNIPTVTLCPEVAKYLELPVATLAMEQPRDMEGVAKRLFCDAYMYMYQSKKMALYK